MNNDLSFTVNLKEADVHNIIVEALRVQFPKHTIKDINFKVGVSGDERFGGSYALTGADVVMEPKAQVTPTEGHHGRRGGGNR